MGTSFSKYHGTGNDFILIDDREEIFDIDDVELINQMCNRRFGIGADGLILLRNKEGYDFQMVYFNSDGRQSSMCGNGGRCIVHFAYRLKVFEEKCTFLAIDGAHEAIVLEDERIKLKMSNVNNIDIDGAALVLDTGSPHYVLQVDKVDDLDIKKEGSKIRYSDKYHKIGVNVNFLEPLDNRIKVATYERGVEDETYSCGTGVTAAAIAVDKMNLEGFSSPISIQTKGGDLKVYFTNVGNHIYKDIWLEGPAIKTFNGIWI